jgi:CRP-like cAMP-binding protein
MVRKKSEHTREGADELRLIARLLALSVTDDKKQKDQIRILAVAGMGRQEIAELIGTTPLTVSVVLSNLKKEGVRRGKKRE